MPKIFPPRLSDSFTFLKAFALIGCVELTCETYFIIIYAYVCTIIYAYVCTPVCLCQRTHKYYNVSFRIWVIKIFISVKMRLKNKLFSEKIWWNGK